MVELLFTSQNEGLEVDLKGMARGKSLITVVLSKRKSDLGINRIV
jgi:hypothetical protein